MVATRVWAAIAGVTLMVGEALGVGVACVGCHWLVIVGWAVTCGVAATMVVAALAVVVAAVVGDASVCCDALAGAELWSVANHAPKRARPTAKTVPQTTSRRCVRI
jgi:hypothetical protein